MRLAQGQQSKRYCSFASLVGGGGHFGWATKAMIDSRNFCAPGSSYTGTIFGTTVLNGQGLVDDRTNVRVPVGRQAGIDS